MSGSTRRSALVAAFLVGLGATLGASVSSAPPVLAQEPSQPEAPTDPFPADVLAFLKRQDELFDEGKHDVLLRETELRAQDGTPDSLYLLGRLHGMLATHYRTVSDPVAFGRHLDLAREAFGASQEKGGLLYAPAYVGLARCCWIEGDLETAAFHLKRAVKVDRHFRMAVLELAQVNWNLELRSEAEDGLHRFLTDHPGDVEARVLLGRMKRARKRWAEARSEFEFALQGDPEHAAARKLLGQTLQFLQQHEAAVVEFERLRHMTPEDPEVYRLEYQSFKALGDVGRAKKILEALVEALPGSEEAVRAKDTLQAIADDPEYFSTSRTPTRELLLKDLESTDPTVVRRALGTMYRLEWERLPPTVYRLLNPELGLPDVRLAAVRLIRRVRNDRALPLLEELVYHPKFADPDLDVRREAARAIVDLDSDATLLIAWQLLQEDDAELREAGVQGIASRTGRYFRPRLDVASPEEQWPTEMAHYRRWWNSTSASLAKRRAVGAMESYFDQRGTSRRRIGVYLLEAMRDGNERTWAAGYALFRKLSYRTFGHALPPVPKEDRDHVTAEATQWFQENVLKQEDASKDE